MNKRSSVVISVVCRYYPIRYARLCQHWDKKKSCLRMRGQTLQLLELGHPLTSACDCCSQSEEYIQNSGSDLSGVRLSMWTILRRFVSHKKLWQSCLHLDDGNLPCRLATTKQRVSFPDNLSQGRGSDLRYSKKKFGDTRI